MAESTSFKALKEQYFFLDSNFNKILGECTTKEQRDKFRHNYINARDNFWEAQNRVFVENDPIVQNLAKELESAQQEIEQLTANLKDISKILDAITTGVKLASSLIVMGSAFA
jgi:hypothetical protein